MGNHFTKTRQVDDELKIRYLSLATYKGLDGVYKDSENNTQTLFIFAKGSERTKRLKEMQTRRQKQFYTSALMHTVPKIFKTLP